MNRETIDFDTFEKNFIAFPAEAYFPVYSCFDEDDEGNPQPVLKIDMICEWRLDDGKIRFFEVPFETKEQFNKLKDYLKIAAGYLYSSILLRLDKLDYENIQKDEQ